MKRWNRKTSRELLTAALEQAGTGNDLDGLETDLARELFNRSEAVLIKRELMKQGDLSRYDADFEALTDPFGEPNDEPEHDHWKGAADA